MSRLNGEPALLGRRDEQQVLRRLLEDARDGRGAALVIRGEAGIGKSALLDDCARMASAFLIRRVTGVESEMELPFAGLHQLCAPMLSSVDDLAEPQRMALRIALGMTPGSAPNHFSIFLGALGLVSEVAARQPLLCLIDDAQWLDAASATALGFVARRLGADSTAIVFALRDDPVDAPQFQGLPELRLEGLAHAEAAALLRTVIPGRLNAGVRDRLVAEAHGNPLALLELPGRLSRAQLPGGFGLGGPQHLREAIEGGFQSQLDRLPGDARLLLLVAAAEPADDPLLIWRAAERLGVRTSSVTAATDGDGLLAIDQRVRFRHPLVRSAVYRSATLEERRSAHLALAHATDADADPDQRAWHLAAAAHGPDEAVALELQRSAGRAQARGGLAAAAAFLRRSAVLTLDPARRLERTLAATQASIQSGEFPAALQLLRSVPASRLNAYQEARVELLKAQVVSASGAGSVAPVMLTEAAKRLEPLDSQLARETHLDAWGAAMFAGSLAEPGGTLREVSEAARRAPPAAHPRSASDLLLDGLALLRVEDRTAAAPVLREAVAKFRAEGFPAEKGPHWGVLASVASAELWDFDSWEAVITGQMKVARDEGALGPMSVAINGVGIVVAWRGELEAAAGVIAEADALTEATQTRVAPYGAMLLAALQGRELDARIRLDATIEIARAGGEGQGIQWAHWTRAVLCNGLSRYEDAVVAAEQAIAEDPAIYVSVWASVELVEAASRTGRARLCSEALDRVVDSATVSKTAWGLGIAARSRALLEEGRQAEANYREAIERLRATPLLPELARAQLLYGEWLRREQRRTDARTQLRNARSIFTSIGAQGFAERALQELLSTGARVRGLAQDQQNELTPQEAHIARLARDGCTNLQIGAQLYLSPRTVEWHLNKVFIKLGIGSRRELADAMPVKKHLAAG